MGREDAATFKVSPLLFFCAVQGEDWEYEDDRADDDLEMGKEDDADLPAPRR